MIPINKPRRVTASGALQQEQPVAEYQSGSTSRVVALRYDSSRANPNSVIEFDVSNPNLYTNPRAVARLSVQQGNFTRRTPGYAGTEFGLQGGEHFWSLPDAAYATSRIAMQANTADLPTGRYNYTLTAGVQQFTGKAFDGDTATAQGNLIVVNRRGSPFGVGWDLSDWQQLAPLSDGSVLLVDGAGTRMVFGAPETPGGDYVSPGGDFSRLERRLDGTFVRTLPDGTTYSFNADHQIGTIRDRVGNSTQFGYDGSGRLVSLTDAAGSATTFAYTAGRISSITDPAGRTTQLVHDAAGNLVRVIMPDGALQEYGYNGRGLLTSQTDPNGNVERNGYSFAGHIQSMAMSDGTAFLVDPVTSRHLLPIYQTNNPVKAPRAQAAVPPVLTTANPNGAVTVQSLDHMNQPIGVHDSVGEVQRVRRDTLNVVVAELSGRGHVTISTYDDRGNLLSTRDEISVSGGMFAGTAEADESRSFQFQGTAGQWLAVTVSAPYSATISLVGAGTETSLSNGSQLVRLPFAGAYEVEYSSPTAGAFRIAIQDGRDGSHALGVGGSVSSAVDARLGADVLRLDIPAAGKRLFLDVQSSEDGVDTLLYDPRGLRVVDDSGLDGVFVAPMAGIYTVLVSQRDDVSEPVHYTLRLTEPPVATVPLALGATTTFAARQTAQRTDYTFHGTAGRLVLFDGLYESYVVGPHVRLISPSGAEVLSSNANDTGVTLLETGAYRLELIARARGNFQFRLLDAATLPVLTFGTLIGGTLGTQTHAYRFAGTAGQQILFDSVRYAGESYANWTVRGPGGRELRGHGFAPGDLSADLRITIPEDGPYQLVLRQFNFRDSVSYRFTATNLSEPSVERSGFGVLHSGSIAPGEVVDFTYRGPAGLPVYLDAQDPAAESLTVQLLDATGRDLFVPYYVSPLRAHEDVAPLILPQSGSYTLRIKGWRESSEGTFKVRLLDLTTAAIPAAIGTAMTGTVQPYEAAIYRFDAPLGHVLVQDGLTSRHDPVRVLVQPLGVFPYISNDLFGFSENLPVVPSGGEHYVVISTRDTLNGPTTTPQDYHVRLIDADSAAVVALSSPISDSLPPGESVRLYRLNGTAGMRVVFDTLAADSFLGFTVFGPGGVPVAGMEDSVVLPADGSYLVRLNVLEHESTVHFTFQMHTPVTNTAALSFDTVVSGNLGDTRQWDQFTLDGFARSLLYVETLRFPEPNLRAVVVSPSGQVQVVSSDGRIPLNETGRHTLRLSGVQGAYEIRVRDLTASRMLSPGAVVLGAIDPANGVDAYAFVATAGQNFQFELLATSVPNAAEWRVEGPGVDVPRRRLLDGGYTFQAPQDGIYQLLANRLAPGGPVAYEFRTHTTPAAAATSFSGRTRYTYDSRFNQLTSMTDELGRLTLFEVDRANGNRLAMHRVVGAPGGDDDLVTRYTYTASGQVATMTDPLGRITRYAYDAQQRLVQTTYAAGTSDEASARLEYDAAGNVTARTDENGNRTVLAYDSRNRLVRMRDPLGNETRYEYDLAGNLIRTIDARGNITAFAYDRRHRLTRQTAADGGVTRYRYDNAGNVVERIDPLGRRTQHRYDYRSRPIEIIDAAGGITRMAYDLDDNLVAIMDPNGHRGITTYDARNRMVGTIDALGHSMTFDYDAADNLIATTDANGHRTSYAYDAIHRPVTTTDALGGLTTSVYDANSNLVERTDALGRTTVFSYDARDRVTRVTDALGHVTQTAYDPAGNSSRIVDPLGHVTQLGYDANHRLVTVTDAAGQITRFEYDAVGNRERVTDALGRVSRVRFDSLNRPIGFSDPLGGTRAMAYDLAGNLVAATDELGRSTRYEYDALDRLIVTTDALGGEWRNTFDPAGNLTSVTDVLGRTNRFDYDALNRRARMTDAAGGAWSYAYDPAGNLISSVDALGRTTRFAYDALNRIVITTDANNGVWHTAYDPVSNRVRVTDPLGRSTQFTYDLLNRLTVTTDAAGGTRTVSHDAAGNVIVSADELGRTTQLTYDVLHRLTAVRDAAGGVWGIDYDAVGNQTATTDALGRVTRYAYDALDRLVTTTDALGNTRTGEYDAADNLISKTDELGRTARFTYDSLNRRTQITDAAGGVWTAAYDAVGNRISTRDALGRTTQFAYDTLDRRTATVDALGGVRGQSYDAVGNLVSTTDELGRTTRFAYDNLNRLARTTDARGGVMAYEYDAVGNRVTSTDQLARSTRFDYDSLNRPTIISDPLGNRLIYAYDAAGQTISATDALGRTTSFVYDALGRLTQTRDADGGTTLAVYDPVGNRIAVSDELNRTTRFGYDALNRPTTFTDPLGNVVSRTYNAVGRVLTATNPLGHSTHQAYDVLDRLTTSTDADGGVTRSTYDAVGNLTSITDPVGNTTQFAYDALDRLTRDTDTLGAARTYQYDAAGNRIAMVDRNGRARRFTYDELDRPISEAWLDGAGNTMRTFERAYDAAGQLTGASDPVSAYQFRYDAAGRLTSKSNPGTPGVPTVEMSYAYDPVGNLLARVDTVGGQVAATTDYEYDRLDRMTRTTQHGSGVRDKRVDFAYDAASQMTGLTRYADLAGTQLVASSSWMYDADGRVTELVHAMALGAQPIRYTWTFDAADRITAATSPDGSSSYSFDATNQLTGATHTGQADESIAYDRNGNRTNTGYQTGPDNRLISDGSYNYEYDAEGNRIRRTEIATGNIVEYEWDYRNRLMRVSFRNSGGDLTRQVDYTYDVFDQRIGKHIDADGAGPAAAHTERFVYDADHIALQFDGAGNETHRYLHGPIVDQILADEDATGRLLWPLTDHLGTVRDLIDSSGSVVNHLRYDSFGQIVGESDPSTDFLFAYTGREFDRETGQYYYRARYYDAAVGRFLSVDPISFAAGDANRYRYVGNEPTIKTDPSGLVECDPKKKKQPKGNAVGGIPGVPSNAPLNVTERDFVADGKHWRSVSWTDTAGKSHTQLYDLGPSQVGPTGPVDPTYNPLYHPRAGGQGSGTGGDGGGGNANGNPTWGGFSYDPHQKLAYLPGGVPFSPPDLDESAKSLLISLEEFLRPLSDVFDLSGTMLAAILARMSGDSSLSESILKNDLLVRAHASDRGVDDTIRAVRNPGKVLRNIPQAARNLRQGIENTGADVAAGRTESGTRNIVGTGVNVYSAAQGVHSLKQALSGLGNIGRGAGLSGSVTRGPTGPGTAPTGHSGSGRVFIGHQDFRDLLSERFTSVRQLRASLSEKGFTQIQEHVPDPEHRGKTLQSEIWMRKIQPQQFGANSGNIPLEPRVELVRIDPWGHHVNLDPQVVPRRDVYHGRRVYAGEPPHFHATALQEHEVREFLQHPRDRATGVFTLGSEVHYNEAGQPTSNLREKHMFIEPRR